MIKYSVLYERLTVRNPVVEPAVWRKRIILGHHFRGACTLYFFLWSFLVVFVFSQMRCANFRPRCTFRKIPLSNRFDRSAPPFCGFWSCFFRTGATLVPQYIYYNSPIRFLAQASPFFVYWGTYSIAVFKSDGKHVWVRTFYVFVLGILSSKFGYPGTSVNFLCSLLLYKSRYVVIRCINAAKLVHFTLWHRSYQCVCHI